MQQDIKDLTIHTKSLLHAKHARLVDITITQIVDISHNQELFCLLAMHCTSFHHKMPACKDIETYIYDMHTEIYFCLGSESKITIVADIIPTYCKLVRICLNNHTCSIILSNKKFEDLLKWNEDIKVLEYDNGIWNPINPRPIHVHLLPCFQFSTKIVSLIKSCGWENNLIYSTDTYSIECFKDWMSINSFRDEKEIFEGYTEYAMQCYLYNRKIITLSYDTIMSMVVRKIS